ncbi:hypothetical protein CEXT_619201 [Caerostris extrusa]|uniref:Uncharacterized protein n=1 Tax=Caerostris extrusa TaxID=172846 RepID=A0AAV4SCD6_CAEEX|nr:hypothetical protein CEXT_619201 [Caerostris extrusa]
MSFSENDLKFSEYKLEFPNFIDLRSEQDKIWQNLWGVGGISCKCRRHRQKGEPEENPFHKSRWEVKLRLQEGQPKLQKFVHQ